MNSIDVLHPRSRQTLRDAMLAAFPPKLLAQSWDETQIARALVEVDADTRALYEARRKDVFDGGYITTAKGPFLDLAATWYGERREPARAALLQVQFNDPTGQGPFQLPAGQIVSYSPDPLTLLFFRTVAQVDIPKGGSVPVYLAAQVAGAASNLPPGSPLTLTTSQPAITITTPPIPGTGSIVAIAGGDAEGDEPLRQRCLLKLTLQGRGWAARTIEGLILDRFPGIVTRVLVLDPWVLNIAAAWLAGPIGPVTPQVAKDVYEYLRARELKPVASYPVQVYQALLQTVAVKIQLVTTGIVKNLIALETAKLLEFQSTLGIGDGVTQVMYSRITDMLDDVAGVYAVEVLDAATGKRLENFAPPFRAAPVFAVTWLPVKVL